MRRCLALAAVASLLATGCHFSPVKAQATVVITGRALDASGHPIAATQVRLFKEADLGEALFGSILSVGTLGLVCLLPSAPAPCRSAHVATTDASGNYRFVLKGSDTQGLIGEVDTLDVVVAAPHSGVDGASTVLRFTAGATSVALPDARLWAASPRVSQSASRIRLGWSTLPAVDGHSVSYTAQLYNTGQVLVWSQSADAGAASIDSRVMEDVSGAAAVSAYATVPGGTATGTVHASYLSPRLRVRPTAGAPPSRGRSCSAVVGTQGVHTAAQSSCPVTNGDLVSAARLIAPKAQIVTGVVVDLGRVRPIHLVVGRGLAGLFVIEVSTDGVHYRQLTSASGTAVAVVPPVPTAARYVMLRSPPGLDESLMSQVSIW